MMCVPFHTLSHITTMLCSGHCLLHNYTVPYNANISMQHPPSHPWYVFTQLPALVWLRSAYGRGGGGASHEQLCCMCIRVCNISGTLVPILGHTPLWCIHNTNTVLPVFVYMYLPGESVYLVHMNLRIFIYVYLYNMLWSVTVEPNSGLVWLKRESWRGVIGLKQV